MSAQLQFDVFSFGPPSASESAPAVLVAVAGDADDLVIGAEAEAAIAAERDELLDGAARARACACCEGALVLDEQDWCVRCGHAASIDNDAGAEPGQGGPG